MSIEILIAKGDNKNSMGHQRNLLSRKTFSLAGHHGNPLRVMVVIKKQADSKERWPVFL